MNAHETYVSLETAKLLKEAGFDWKCSSLYTSDGEFKHLLHNTIDWDYGEVDWNNVTRKETSYMGIKGWEGGYSAPTLDVAQRWLRENNNMHILIDCIGRQNWLPTIQYMTSDKDIIVQDNAKPKMCSKYYGYDTYEEGLEAGIKKALEIILEKGK